MNQQHDMTRNASPIPPLVWFLTIGVLLGLTAIVILKIPVGTVANYGLLALLVGGHFFMHGSYGAHEASAGHDHIVRRRTPLNPTSPSRINIPVMQADAIRAPRVLPVRRAKRRIW